MDILSDITKQREELAELDREIVKLVGRRNKISRVIGERKAASGEEVFVPAVEKIVVHRYVDSGKIYGVSELAATRIARAVIDESVDVQGRVPRPAVPRKIFIIGGNGNMGRWLSLFFTERGHTVLIDDHNPNGAEYPVTDIPTGCRDADVIVVSTPITVAEKILEEVFAQKTHALIFDILSVKTPVIPLLRRAAEAGVRVCSVHPMFGPGASSVAGRNIVVCDCGNLNAVKETAQLFSGGTILRMDVEEHDRIAACVLGLSHAVNLAFSGALARSGFSYEELCSAASTTFRKQIAVSREVSEENAALYYAIQRENPCNDAALENLSEALQELRTLGKEEFILKMHEGARWYETK